MTPTVRSEPPVIRPYDHARDFDEILERLGDWLTPGDHLPAWHRARWAYMHHHPNIDDLDLTRFGVAEGPEGIVGVVHQEHAPAFAYLQHGPGWEATVEPLIDWAEAHFGGWSRTLRRTALGFWVERCHSTVVDALQQRHYERTNHTGSWARFELAKPVAAAPPPDGYRITTLAEDNDLAKINRVLWRGFEHPGDPPAEEIPGRARVQQAPGFRLDRTVVAVAPSGDFASYAGIWLDEANRSAYVEPVATDPDHRRIGLGRAAVTEALRLVRDDGATHAWVGSDQAFYLSMGFRITCTADLWVRPG